MFFFSTLTLKLLKLIIIIQYLISIQCFDNIIYLLVYEWFHIDNYLNFCKYVMVKVYNLVLFSYDKTI